MSDVSVSERIARQRGLRDEVEEEMPDLETETLKGDDSLVQGEGAEATVGITETEDEDDDEVLAGQAADDAEDLALGVEALREATAKQWERDVHEFGVRNAEVLQAVRPPLMELGWKVAAFTSKDNDKSRVLTIQLTGRSAFAQLAMPYESEGGEPVGRFENAPKGKGFQVDGSGVVQVEESADEDEEEEVESIGPAGLGIEAEFDPDDLPDG